MFRRPTHAQVRHGDDRAGDPAGIIAKLKAAKVAYFTEPVATEKGKVTRVRAGPYASREAAEKAHKQLEKLGFKPGNIATRS